MRPQAAAQSAAHSVAVLPATSATRFRLFGTSFRIAVASSRSTPALPPADLSADALFRHINANLGDHHKCRRGETALIQSAPRCRGETDPSGLKKRPRLTWRDGNHLRQQNFTAVSGSNIFSRSVFDESGFVEGVALRRDPSTRDGR
ncbi:hypothetical protein HPP92_003738 [Vanilla planifolia]|uniref:Uncharacterized protein n=1 Tax=Vanilla planifolia TaxID=51239 RepID=A0A835VNX9_VANPL|nr:hypothetical protein HPP92_003738 [Vanilla planifolia]